VFLDWDHVLDCGAVVSVDFNITTTMTWDSDQPSKRKLTVCAGPLGNLVIRYDVQGLQDQLLEMDEHAWHALYEMMGEVKP
jgi:hypothetical protein